MGVINTGSFAKAMRPGVKEWWGRFYDEHPKEYLEILDDTGSDKNYEEYAQATGFSYASQKNQGSSVAYDSETQGYISRLTNATYSNGYICTMEEIQDNQYAKLAKTRTQALAFSINSTLNLLAANVYNNAFDSSYTGGDGKELLATDHPNVSGGTFQNEPTTETDFSETALEDLCILIMNATNDRGLPIALMPKSLHVPTALWYEANRVLKSELQNDTANNATNALRVTGALPGGIMVNHWFDDSDAWFVRTNLSGPGMIYQNRMPVQFDQDEDFDTSNVKYKAVFRAAFGWADPRALFGSPGA